MGRNIAAIATNPNIKDLVVFVIVFETSHQIAIGAQ
jgi:hypothetical protein